MLNTRTLLFLVAVASFYTTAVTAKTFGIALSPQQKRLFVDALISTPYDALEAELPVKLRSLHRFSPYFSMYELASTAYALVLENPADIRRWRALAKLDSYADGEYAPSYDNARKEALARNPHLFDSCPQFRTWSEEYRHGHTKALTKRCSQPLAGEMSRSTL